MLGERLGPCTLARQLELSRGLAPRVLGHATVGHFANVSDWARLDQGMQELHTPASLAAARALLRIDAGAAARCAQAGAARRPAGSLRGRAGPRPHRHRRKPGPAAATDGEPQLVGALPRRTVSDRYARDMLDHVMAQRGLRVRAGAAQPERFPIDVSLVQTRADGHRVGVCVARELSEVQRVERMKHEFVSMVSHELRTPLTSIHGSLALLAESADDLAPTVKRLIGLAHDNSERLVALVDDIRDFEKPRAGQMRIEAMALDLRAGDNARGGQRSGPRRAAGLCRPPVRALCPGRQPRYTQARRHRPGSGDQPRLDRAHAGQIGLAPEQPGQGALFWLTLPLHPPAVGP